MYASATDGSSATCSNCDTTTTPLWRKTDAGINLCNACGLFLKLHGKSRPVAFTSGIIKSRNRSKLSPPNAMKRKTPYDIPPYQDKHYSKNYHNSHSNGRTQSLPGAKRSEGQAGIVPYTPHPRSLVSSQQDPAVESTTPAAQYIRDIFDPTSHPQSPTPIAGRESSPSPFNAHTLVGLVLADQPSITNGTETRRDADDGHSGSDRSATVGSNFVVAGLKARVTELELVNDLFRSRILELEHQIMDYSTNGAPSTSLDSSKEAGVASPVDTIGSTKSGAQQVAAMAPNEEVILLRRRVEELQIQMQELQAHQQLAS